MSAALSALEPARNLKAISLTIIRGWIRERPGAYEQLTAQLDADDQRFFGSFGATDWISAEPAARVMDVAARVLHPDDPTPQRRLGRELAREQLHGVYRFLLRVISPPTLIDQTATLWSRNHRAGHATTERLSERAAQIRVTAYPTFPLVIRENTAGYIGGAVELTGAENVRVVCGGDPARWTWNVTWR